MKVKLKIEKNYDAKWLHVRAGVRYWEDATVNGVEDEKGDLIPCRDGDDWKPRINVETGEIVNWRQGTKAEIHYKVCDDGDYRLLDAEQNQITFVDGYVISSLCPKENGYGDYIIMNVDENGMIENWEFNPKDFEDED